MRHDTVHRTDEMVLVGYFLARMGNREPPPVLRTTRWRVAYAMFYAALGAGRSLVSFSSSLKNSRDEFDSHLSSGRSGWFERPGDGETRRPKRLQRRARQPMEEWKQRTDRELWAAVRQFADLGVSEVPSLILDDIAARGDAETATESRTEGGRRVVISCRTERDPRLRAAAVRFHGLDCAVCGFNFEKAYGSWGRGYAEVHHVRPLGDGEDGERETDPRTDLVVVCGNCHRMIHRPRGRTLAVGELQERMRMVDR